VTIAPHLKFFKSFLVIECLLLVLAITLPLATIDEFWFFSSEFSVLSLAVTLFRGQEYTLSFIIVLFGFIVPALKIFQRLFSNRWFAKLELNKFSMLDIFLLSFLIFGGKLSYFYEVNLQIGFYFLVSSICLSYIPTARFDKLTPRQN
tara:strand:- start:1175 stop:1618 length:444 start_codon:yes stop_codon:yes gene_type:complete